MGGGVSKGTSRRKPSILTILPCSVTFSRRKIARKASTVSRIGVTGLRKGTPIHPCMILGVEMPSPSTKRPPVISCAVMADMAIRAGGRLKTGTIAVPKRIFENRMEEALMGERASELYDSKAHPRLKPQPWEVP